MPTQKQSPLKNKVRMIMVRCWSAEMTARNRNNDTRMTRTRRMMTTAMIIRMMRLGNLRMDIII